MQQPTLKENSIMSSIKFPKEQKDALVSKLRTYTNDELGQDLGQFDAEFLLDFFTEEIGAYYYNRGLSDARTLLSSKFEDIDHALYEIEKPTKFNI